MALYATLKARGAKIIEAPVLRAYKCYEMVVEDNFDFRFQNPNGWPATDSTTVHWEYASSHPLSSVCAKMRVPATLQGAATS